MAIEFNNWTQASAAEPSRRGWTDVGMNIKCRDETGAPCGLVFTPEKWELIAVRGDPLRDDAPILVIGWISPERIESLRALWGGHDFEIEQLERYIELSGGEVFEPQGPSISPIEFDRIETKLLLGALERRLAAGTHPSLRGPVDERALMSALLPVETPARFESYAGEKILLFGNPEAQTPLTLTSNSRVGVGGRYVAVLDAQRGPLAIADALSPRELGPLELCELIHDEIEAWL